MNCEQANKLSIIDFLGKQNIYPKRKSKQYTFYFSPFRDEKEPSFIVNSSNQWHDFGSGEHGSLVDFVIKWQNCSISNALKFIENSSCSFSFHKQNCVEKSNIIIQQVKPYVTHNALLNYLKSRAIEPNKVKNEIEEIWYTNGNKIFFGIAFKNNLNGYEMRNKFDKRSIIKKDITTIYNGADRIVIFEGFFDYLSYLMLGWNKVQTDYLILNSTAMFERSIPILKKYKEKYSYLDNDKAGKDCFEKIKYKVHGLINRSDSFSHYNDLNEYLMRRKRPER